MAGFKFQFDPDLGYQLHAIESIVDLFEGQPPSIDVGPGAEVVPNLGEYDSLDYSWLADNLRDVQERNNREERGSSVDVLMDNEPELDSGLMLDGVSNDSHDCPHFTIEMETGTGKTYVYLRTIRELYQKYGWRKFVIVVPSIAILEGVKKSFEITQSHLAAIYGNEPFALIEYDGSQLGRLRDFASNQFPTILLMTLQSFNSKINTFFKATDKLAGERLPYEFVQEARPIVILDEPQNMETERSQQAIRTLAPLFVLRYSATHVSSPNTVYRLTPVNSFRQGLVKQIQVIGVSDIDVQDASMLRLESVSKKKGQKPTATVRASSIDDGRVRQVDLALKGGDDLFAKTKNPAYKGKIVENIVKGKGGTPDQVVLNDGSVLTTNDALGNREAIFRAQIEKTIETHLKHQQRLKKHGVKVLSLFFIDRVASYRDPEDGLIKRLFDESFERLKKGYADFASHSAEEVREAYFAVMRNSKTGEERYVEDKISRADEREAAKEAFELIMKKKEQLLSFDEPVSFIFAHSALKEGWDNPNVFQICTLNNTVSERKKRQEIGRGLRLCVDQQGTRPDHLNLNVLTVIANESYESYVDALQKEYTDDGYEAPERPKKPREGTAIRRDDLLNTSEFQDFWSRLRQRLHYQIHIDEKDLLEQCLKRLSAATFPEPKLTISQGYFVFTEYKLSASSKLLSDGRARLVVERRSSGAQGTLGDDSSWVDSTYEVSEGGKLKGLDSDFRGFKVTRVDQVAGEPLIELDTPDGNVSVTPSRVYQFTKKQPPAVQSKERRVGTENYPIPDFISRAAEATGLTRATVFKLFRYLPERTKEKLPKNPEGWSNVFLGAIQEAVADHVAQKLEYYGKFDSDQELADLFPSEVSQPQAELEDGGSRSLYDKVQVDSLVERDFINGSIKSDEDNIVFYFKFPPRFKIGLPRIIGNYNPDWGIVRKNGNGVKLELIRETKGTEDESQLRFPHEKRKIWAARRYFARLGIDYRVVTDKTEQYWRESDHKPPIDFGDSASDHGD